MHDALAAAALFFLSSFSPKESAAVFAMVPVTFVRDALMPELRYPLRCAIESVRFSVMVAQGRLKKWNKREWVLQTTLRLDHERLSTMLHSERSGRIMREFGHYLKWTPEEIEDGEYAAAMHDLGKLCIPLGILEKKGALTPQEMRIMKRHVNWSVRFIRWMPGFKSILHVVADHHESYNGTGYPKGSRGNMISRVTHSLAIVDAYDAMTHARYYRPAQTANNAFKELQRCAGHQFDPELVDKFIDFMMAHGDDFDAQPPPIGPDPNDPRLAPLKSNFMRMFLSAA